MTTFVFLSGPKPGRRILHVLSEAMYGKGKPRHPSRNERLVMSGAPTGLAVPAEMLARTWVVASRGHELGDELISNVRDEVMIEGKALEETDVWRLLDGYARVAERITIITVVGSVVPAAWFACTSPREFADHVARLAADNLPVNAVYSGLVEAVLAHPCR